MPPTPTFSQLINKVAPGTIDLRVLNLDRNTPMTLAKACENINLAIESAKSIGCVVLGLDSGVVLDETPYMILGVIWQLLKMFFL